MDEPSCPNTNSESKVTLVPCKKTLLWLTIDLRTLWLYPIIIVFFVAVVYWFFPLQYVPVIKHDPSLHFLSYLWDKYARMTAKMSRFKLPFYQLLLFFDYFYCQSQHRRKHPGSDQRERIYARTLILCGWNTQNRVKDRSILASDKDHCAESDAFLEKSSVAGCFWAYKKFDCYKIRRFRTRLGGWWRKCFDVRWAAVE